MNNNNDKHNTAVTCYLNDPVGYTNLTGESPFRSPSDFPLTGMCVLSNVLNNNNNNNNIVHASNVINYPGGGSSSTGSYHSSLATNSTLLENGNGSVASSSNASSSLKGVDTFKYSAYETLELNRLLNTVHLIDPTTGQTLNLYATTSNPNEQTTFGGQQRQQQQHSTQASFELSNTAGFEKDTTSGEARGLHVTLCDATTLLATPILFPTFSASSSTTSSEQAPVSGATTSTLFIADPKHSESFVPVSMHINLKVN